MLASLSLRKSDVCGIAKRLSGTGTSGVCVLFAFLDWMDTSSLSTGYWLDGQIFMKLSGETQNTLPVFSFASLNTSWLEKDGNCMKLQIALAKGLVVERHWPLQCHTFPCPGQTRWETPFSPWDVRFNARLGQLEVFEQPCASPRFVAMAPTRRPATFCNFPKSKTPRCISSFHVVNFFKSICGRELAMQIAEVLYVLEFSQLLTCFFIFNWLNRELFTRQKGIIFWES